MELHEKHTIKRKEWSSVQKAVIPRNWLFGRITACRANLRHISRSDGSLTAEEQLEFTSICVRLTHLILNKEQGSNQLKDQLK